MTKRIQNRVAESRNTLPVMLIDGLLVWGLVDWGLGVVYRLTPASAVYHLTEPKNNFALFFTATLEL